MTTYLGDETHARIAALIEAGTPVADIAAAVQVSKMTVRRARIRCGGEPFRRVLNDEEHSRIVTLTRAGESAARIARLLGVSERTVVRHRVKAGIAPPRAPLLSEAEKARAAELLDDGASFAEVARTLGRSMHAISSAFPGRGWTRSQVYEYRTALRNAKGIL